VILGIIMIIVIASYEHRLSRLERVWYGPMHTRTFMMPRVVSDVSFEDIDKTWSEMNQRMQDLEKRQQKVFQELSQAPKVINDGQYTGYRVTNDKTFQYTLSVKKDTLTGTLLGTDTDTINRYTTAIKKLSITTTNTNGTTQFTAPKEKLQAIVQILNT